MKNRFIIVYTVFAAIVFVFSLSFFGVNLYREYSSNLEKSDAKIKTLTSDIRTLSYNHIENTDSYAKAIKDTIGDPSAFAFIQVKRDGETLVLYPAGKINEETTSNLTKSFEKSITVNDKKVDLYFNVYLIRPDSIFYYARISFLLILIITLITVIMIIYLSISEDNPNKSVDEEENDESDYNEVSDSIEVYDPTENTSSTVAEEKESLDDKSENAEENQNIENSESVEIAETSENPESPVENTDDKPSDIENQQIESENKAEEEAVEEEKAPVEVTPEEVKAILSEPLTDAQIENTQEAKLPIDEIKPEPAKLNEDEDPTGLFNPETGIGWESYLHTRLENEINRATASEIDLALFVFKLRNISKTSDTFKNVCNYLAIQFQFKDLLFEYKEDCIVAIKISMNVDEAINLADKLHSDICNILNGSDCRIGISSRSIRMVTGDRLMLEAEQAIEHSDETSPVIAFRVDSEKYRQMMEHNQKA